MNQVIRVMLVDDQSLFREGLRTLLSVQPDFEVVAEASNGEEALRLAAQKHPHVVLMDLRMPVLDGVSATRRMRELFPDIRVLALTTFDDDENLFGAIRAGAVGYLLKDISSDRLFEALRTAARGEYYLMPSSTARIVEEFSRIAAAPIQPATQLPDPLSAREVEILRMVATGASNREIADTLVIAEGTVKNHLTSILAKLSAKDRMQAVLRARELRII